MDLHIFRLRDLKICVFLQTEIKNHRLIDA